MANASIRLDLDLEWCVENAATHSLVQIRPFAEDLLAKVRRGRHFPTSKKKRGLAPPFPRSYSQKSYQLHPVVDPHVSHFRQVPLRTSVKFEHSGQASPS
jgi:hypothetical protein